MSNGFYLKLTNEQASSMIVDGIDKMFGGTVSKFVEYTFSVEDEASGDKYWYVENLEYNGVLYDVIGWLDSEYPELIRYTHEYVSQLINDDMIK